MREFLVTKFCCASCGRNLQLTYDLPKVAGRYAQGEPTGAAMVQHHIAIQPCECVTTPLAEIRKAAGLLFGQVKG